jgi:hypothetical protein
MDTATPDPASIQTQRCASCNARQRPERLSLTYMLHRLREDVFGTERGLFLTIWHLLVKPQQVTSAFIKGDSLRYYSPIKYFIVMFALSIFASSSSALFDSTIADLIANKGLASKEVAQAFVADWNVLLYLPLVLILALATRGFFRETGLNYAEHLVIAAYGWSQMVLLGAVVYLAAKCFRWIGLTNGWFAILLLMSPMYWIWYCHAVFSQKNLIGWLRALVTAPVALICYLLLLLAVAEIIKTALQIK